MFDCSVDEMILTFPPPPLPPYFLREVEWEDCQT